MTGVAPASPPAPSPKRARRGAVQRSAFWWAVSKYLVLGFSKLYFRLRVEGRDHVPATGAVLLVANHASYIDPPLVGISTRRWVAFLAQAGLARLGPMRWWLGQMGVTLIDRSAPSKEALRLIAECLGNGEVVGIFPEGTRSADGSVAPFRNGVEFLVRRTGATVVPIGLDGNHRAYPRRAWLPRPRRIVVRYGEPWSAERVLAPGGIEALRRRVAELARAPLQPTEGGGGAAATPHSASPLPPVAESLRPNGSRSDSIPPPSAAPSAKPASDRGGSFPSAGGGA
jgi:1-acyl-sn-glycerol-3-phosphate acyltransferase